MCDAPVVGLHAPRQELLSPVPAGPWSEGSCGCPALCQPQFLGEATRLWHAGMGLAATQWLKSPHVLEGDETLAQDAQRGTSCALGGGGGMGVASLEEEINLLP